MKRSFFGYKISEVDTLIETLREENESLNTELSKLKIEAKNNPGSKNAKYILLEENLKKYEDDLIRLDKENKALQEQVIYLQDKLAYLQQEKATTPASS